MFTDRSVPAEIKAIALALEAHKTNPASEGALQLVQLMSPAPRLKLHIELPDKDDRTSLSGLYIERLRKLGSGDDKLEVSGVAEMSGVRRDNLADSSRDGFEMSFRMATVYGVVSQSSVIDCDVVVPLSIISGVGMADERKDKPQTL